MVDEWLRLQNCETAIDQLAWLGLCLMIPKATIMLKVHEWFLTFQARFKLEMSSTIDSIRGVLGSSDLWCDFD